MGKPKLELGPRNWIGRGVLWQTSIAPGCGKGERGSCRALTTTSSRAFVPPWNRDALRPTALGPVHLAPDQARNPSCLADQAALPKQMPLSQPDSSKVSARHCRQGTKETRRSTADREITRASGSRRAPAASRMSASLAQALPRVARSAPKQGARWRRPHGSNSKCCCDRRAHNRGMHTCCRPPWSLAAPVTVGPHRAWADAGHRFVLGTGRPDARGADGTE